MRLQFGDSTGTIELVGFNDELLKIEKCSIDKFYKITNADVKFTKGKTQAWDDTSVTNIELVLNKITIIDEYTEKEKLFKIFEKPQATSSNENKQNKDNHMFISIISATRVRSFIYGVGKLLSF